jgi:hypothetical protein
MTIGIAVLVLFFIIINGFFHENNRLLEERNFWQEKTIAMEESLNDLKQIKEELQLKIDEHDEGLVIKEVLIESLSFFPSEQGSLEYNLSITVENSSSQVIPPANGFLFFAFQTPGGDKIIRTSWRRCELPSFNSKEVKVLHLSGKISAQPREEMLLIVNLNNQPGLIKKRIVLPSLPIKKPELPQVENP